MAKRYRFRKFHLIDVGIVPIHPSGGILLTTIYRGNYYKHRYFGYSLRDARNHFKELVISDNN